MPTTVSATKSQSKPPRPDPAPVGDDERAASRRWSMGWLLIGCAAVVVISLFLPWIAADPEATSAPVPKQLYGFEWDTAWVAAAFAIGLGIYGWQALVRPRVRFHILALIALLYVISVPLLGVATADDAVVERLDAGPGAGQEKGELGFGNAEAVDDRYGVGVAGVAGLVAIVPLSVLWRDARRRRKHLELAARVASEARQQAAAPPPPPPPAAARVNGPGAGE